MNIQFVLHWKHITSPLTLYLTSAEPSRLILFGERVAVYCENRTEHTDTLYGHSVPHRRHHFSTTEPNRLMLYGETVAVCCENRTEHTDTLLAVRTSQDTHHVSTT
jgi:hypothetical protein